MLQVYNTLTRRKEALHPLEADAVRMYACGPTVYDYAHIGNLRSYLFEDFLRRTLEYAGLPVKHVVNITDVGHLVSDADTGEDKMQKALAREHLPPTVESLRLLAERYTTAFRQDIAALNILPPHVMPKATDHVPQMIEIISGLIANGFAYVTELAVYFDVAKFPTYTQLSGQRLQDKSVGAREGVEVDPDKRQPADFALWFKLAGKNRNHVVHWPSPWGEGFPGWHIECSAMSRQHLGFPFDIHCGGVDHIAVHHTNEIAQNEGFFGRPTVRVWMHGEFLDLGQAKMAKSAGTFLRLADLVQRGFDPLAFRYLCLNTHYRQKLNFSWEALEGAAAALKKMRRSVAEYRNLEISGSLSVGCAEYEARFREAIFDDINLPKALGVVWEMMADPKLPAAAKRRSLNQFDRVLGLNLADAKTFAVPDEVRQLAAERERFRVAKDWPAADRVRQAIEARGYLVEDTPAGPAVKPKNY
ncbi:MAG: cysteine--tRNA ligase [Patescibacteria group bacterium]|nr:cysteine--tRNA ligase [Patescibacteria group bacterium]